MLIIGHRGAAGLAPENTLASLQAGFDAGVDILEFDVRITSDGIPILAHDPWIKGRNIKNHSLSQLQQLTDITTLESVYSTFFGKVLLNVELKQANGVDIVLRMTERYIKHEEDWDDVLFSSFRIRALKELRRLNANANLALLHHINPFLFMKHHKRLEFSAVGFHRLHVNSLALAVAQKLSIFTYVYTVDRPMSAKRLARKHLDGIVTNYPDRIADTLHADA